MFPVRNPASTRPWQYVLEPLSGYLTLAERLHGGHTAASSAFNFGPSTEGNSSVGDVVDAMTQRWGDGPDDVAVAAHDGQPHRGQRHGRTLVAPLVAIEGRLQ